MRTLSFQYQQKDHTEKDDKSEIQAFLSSSIQEPHSHIFTVKQDLQKVFNEQKSLKKYFDALNLCPFQDNLAHQTKNELVEKLIKNNFLLIQNQAKQFKRFSFRPKFLQKTQNYEILEFFCQLGPYSKNYVVLYSKKKSFRHQGYTQIGHGTFGDVFGFETSQKQNFAVKCLKHKQKYFEPFLKNVQQFMIADIMSTLEIGPKLMKNNGFDFVIFQNCIEFGMEMCSPIKAETLDYELKLNLFKMHTLKIVHCDIKPANIMFSESFQKNVFIDFGIAQALGQQIWEKTQTKFKGTYSFASIEMKNIFSKTEFCFINLYMNDVEMLNNSLNETKKRELEQIYKITWKNEKSSSFSQESLYERLLMFRFYLYIFEMNSTFGMMFQSFLEELINQIIHQENQFIFREFQEIYDGMNEEIKVFLLNNFLWKNPSFWHAFIESQNTSQKYSNTVVQKQNDRSFYDILKDELKKYESNFQRIPTQSGQNLKKQKQLCFDKNKKENLKFLLNSTQQIIKFSEQEYFELFLQYVSFWKGLKGVSIQEKQKVSSIFKFLYHSQFGSDHKIPKYLVKMYLPEERFIKEKCNNLVWVFGFLLSYFMDKEMDQFGAGNFMVIVKDCIFLNFKYELFVRECLKKYLSFLILRKQHILLASSVIQCFELIQLIESQFRIISQPSLLIEKKLNDELPEILKEILMNEEVKLQFDSQKNSKKQIFSNILLLFSEKRQILSGYERSQSRFFELNFQLNGQKMIEEIEKQLSVHNDFSFLIIYQKAVKIIYFERFYHSGNVQTFPKSSLVRSFHQFSSIQQPFDVSQLVFLRKIKSEKTAENLMKYVEDKINCSQISFYFLLPQKFNLYYSQKNKPELEKVLDLIFKNVESVLYNSSIFLRVNMEHDKLEFFSFLFNNYEYICHRRRICMKMIQYFSRHSQRHNNNFVSYAFIMTEHLQTQFQKNYNEEFQSINKNNEYLNALERVSITYLNEIGLTMATCMVLLQFFYVLRVQVKNIENEERFFYIRLWIMKQVLHYSNSLFPLNSQHRIDSISIENSNFIEQHFYAQKPFLISPLRLNQNSIYLLSDMLQVFDEEQTKLSHTYMKIKKLKFTFFNENMKNQTLSFKHLYSRIFSFKKPVHQCPDDQIQFYQILAQYSAQCYSQMDSNDYRLFSKRIINLQYQFDTFQEGSEFIKNILLYLFQLEQKYRKKLNNITLFPLYLNLLYMRNFIELWPQLHKKLLLKVCELYDKFSSSRQKIFSYGENVTIKHQTLEQILFLSLLYVQKNRSQRKRNILLRRSICKIKNLRLFYQIGFLSYLKLFAFKLISQINHQKNQKKTLKNSIRNLINRRAKRFIVFSYFQQNELVDKQTNLDENQNFKQIYKVGQSVAGEQQKYYMNQKKIKIHERKKFKPKINYNPIVQESMRIRQLLLQQQFILLSKKVYRQTGKRFEDISWIKQIN